MKVIVSLLMLNVLVCLFVSGCFTEEDDARVNRIMTSAIRLSKKVEADREGYRKMINMAKNLLDFSK